MPQVLLKFKWKFFKVINFFKISVSAGLSSGFVREDDTYDVYTERWNETGESRVAKATYRPKDTEDNDNYGDVETYKSAKKFVADRGFEGTQEGQAAKRTGPVQFEKDRDDPFGLDDFLDKAKGSGPAAKKPRNWECIFGIRIL